MNMLLQKTTAAQLLALITANNGTLTSVQLAPVCVGESKDSHYNFMNKAKKVLGEGIVNFYDTIEIKDLNGNVTGTRKILVLPKREATLMAMSYSYELQAQVYDAYEAYEKALQQVATAETLEAAQVIAKEALDKRLFDAIGSKHGRVGTLIKEAYDENTPTKAHKLVEGVYLAQDPVFANDKAYRDKFISAWFRAMDVAIEEAHNEGDTMLKTWLEARKGDVHAIRGRILKRRLTFAEKQVEQLKSQVQPAPVVEVNEVQEPAPMFDYDISLLSLFTAEEIEASRIH